MHFRYNPTDKLNERPYLFGAGWAPSTFLFLEKQRGVTTRVDGVELESNRCSKKKKE